MMSCNLLLTGIISFLAIQFSYSLSCDFEQNDIDFFFIKKLKKEEKDLIDLYGYFPDYKIKNKEFKEVSGIRMKNTDLSLGIEIIFKPLYQIPNNYGYILYNDNPPDDVTERINPLKKSNNYRKAKGILAWEDKGNGKLEGIWFAHRFDKFLPKFASGGTEFRFNNSILKQQKMYENYLDFVCVKVHTDGIKKILEYLFYINANIYEQNNKGIEHLYKEAENAKKETGLFSSIFGYNIFSFKISAEQSFKILTLKERLCFKKLIKKNKKNLAKKICLLEVITVLEVYNIGDMI